MNVKCPRCGAEFPYSLIAIQFPLKRKYDYALIRKIIQDLGPIFMGEIIDCYNETYPAHKIYLRVLNYILCDMEKRGEIKRTTLTSVGKGGRYGRTTVVSLA